jgi:peroxiredoxin
MAGPMEKSKAAQTIARVMNIATKIIAGLAVVATGVFGAFLAAPHRAPTDARVATLDGKSFVLSELRGKVTVVSFWATWCAECLREMPKKVAAWRKYAPRGYEMVAIAVRDRPESVAAYSQRHALPFKVALDSGDAAQRFGNVRITPTTFVIDRSGRVVKRFVGEPNWKEFEAVVENALAH